MHALTPTRREICLVVLLLVVLLLLSDANFDLGLRTSPISPFHRAGTKPVADSSTLSDEYEERLQRTRLDWTLSRIPETKVVAHVPGMLYFPVLF